MDECTVTEFEAGEGQAIVVYEPAETRNIIDAEAVWQFVARDAAERAAAGWRIAATTTLSLRQMEAVLDDSQYEVQAAITVVYAQR